MKKIKAKELLVLLKNVPNVRFDVIGDGYILLSVNNQNSIKLDTDCEIYFKDNAKVIAKNGDVLNYCIMSENGDVRIYFGLDSNVTATIF